MVAAASTTFGGGGVGLRDNRTDSGGRSGKTVALSKGMEVGSACAIIVGAIAFGVKSRSVMAAALDSFGGGGVGLRDNRTDSGGRSGKTVALSIGKNGSGSPLGLGVGAGVKSRISGVC